MFPVSRRSVRGFAQIESIIALLIVSILLGVLIAVIQKVREHARHTHYISTLKHLAAAKLPEAIFAMCIDKQKIVLYNSRIQG